MVFSISFMICGKFWIGPYATFLEKMSFMLQFKHKVVNLFSYLSRKSLYILQSYPYFQALFPLSSSQNICIYTDIKWQYINN